MRLWVWWPTSIQLPQHDHWALSVSWLLLSIGVSEQSFHRLDREESADFSFEGKKRIRVLPQEPSKGSFDSPVRIIWRSWIHIPIHTINGCSIAGNLQPMVGAITVGRWQHHWLPLWRCGESDQRNLIPKMPRLIWRAHLLHLAWAVKWIETSQRNLRVTSAYRIVSRAISHLSHYWLLSNEWPGGENKGTEEKKTNHRFIWRVRLDGMYSHSEKTKLIYIWRFSRGTFIRWLIRVIALGLQLAPLLNQGSQSSCLLPEMHWIIMAKSKGVRIIVTLECTECRTATAAEKRSSGVSRYTTTKNRRNNPERLELMKFCPQLNRMTLHREIK